ncbi:hypothetical protein NUW58_g5086 [Xylaria curta]|uniref:Uncharacterized protein n=1 Tax=Xylaria curta TaxID=42375 RepID=A0ACC1P3C6_9PEZI|nr:hypothetical protein NUW58_g5086 [Xylaria curta]
MRGAASAAQQRMANLGRSETPEATIHHHETRTSRRFGREVTREATEEPQQMIVKLRVSKEKLRKLLRDIKLRQGTPAGSITPSQSHSRVPNTSVSSMPPPSTPNAAASAAPARIPPNAIPPGQIGREDAPAPKPDGAQPTPFKQEDAYKNDQFEGIMRYTAMDTDTGVAVPIPQAGQTAPPNVRFYFLPRIRCSDCPGKLYTPGPDTSASNFEVHLKNKAHKERVEARISSAK